MEPVKRGRGRPFINKVKIAQKNRNKTKNQSQQTIYDTSSEDENKRKKSQGWDQEKLSIRYKPQKLVGRAKQKQKINDFVNGCLIKQINNRCLYISGCPGIGKTVTVMEIVNQIGKSIDPRKAKFQYINCLTVKQPHSIYKSLLLSTKKKIDSKKQPYLLAMEFDKFLKTTKTHFFMIIDEVDFLYTKNENVIYNIVEWCSQGVYNFSIILIANTMDFPQKLAPKISSRMGSWRMCFKPYSSEQIRQILKDRLQGTNFFEQKAINFATKKFAVYTSDLRKVFSILKQVIQSRKGKKVRIQDITTVWNLLVEEEDISWKQQLPEIYNEILDAIKREGGKSHSYTLFALLSQRKITSKQIELVLVDLGQMGLVKLVQKSQKGCMGYTATLNSV